MSVKIESLLFIYYNLKLKDKIQEPRDKIKDKRTKSKEQRTKRKKLLMPEHQYWKTQEKQLFDVLTINLVYKKLPLIELRGCLFTPIHELPIPTVILVRTK